MKKLIFTAALAVAELASHANAQIQKGNWFVGGTIMNADFGLDKGSGYNISLEPKGAYFIQDNLAIGGLVNFGFAGQKNAPTTYVYGVGALGRYYLSPGEKGVDNLLKHGRFFLEGTAGIGGQSISDGGDSTTGLTLGVGPGYAYFITPNISLEGMLKFKTVVGFGDTPSSSRINFGLGFSIYLPTSKGKQIINEVK